MLYWCQSHYTDMTSVNLISHKTPYHSISNYACFAWGELRRPWWMLYGLKHLENIGWRLIFLIHVLILTSCERFVVNKKVIYIWKTFPCVPWGIPGPFPQYITCAVHHVKKAAGSILITSTWTLKAKQVCPCFLCLHQNVKFSSVCLSLIITSLPMHAMK